jgi:hypothetical protein
MRVFFSKTRGQNGLGHPIQPEGFSDAQAFITVSRR